MVLYATSPSEKDISPYFRVKTFFPTKKRKKERKNRKKRKKERKKEREKE